MQINKKMGRSLSRITQISGNPPIDTSDLPATKQRDGIYYYPNADRKFRVGSKAS